MSIPVTCPSCKASFKVKDKCAGQRGRCPKCRGMIDVPAAAPQEELYTSWLDGIDDEPSSPPQPTAPSKPVAPQPAPKPRPAAARPAAARPAAARPAAAASRPTPQGNEKIEFPCPHCGTRFRVAAAYAGQTTKCQDCGGSLTIPAPSAAVADDAMTAEVVAAPLPSAPLGASGGGFDDLLGDAPLPAAPSGGNPFGPLPGKALPQAQKTKPKQKKASVSFDGVGWPDITAACILVMVLPVWFVTDWGVAANLVSFGCFLILLIQMFSHNRVGVALVSFVLCCGVGQLIAAQQSFTNPDWRSQKVASLLLVAYFLNVVYFATVFPAKMEEWERQLDEMERAQAQQESPFEQHVRHEPFERPREPLPRQQWNQPQQPLKKIEPLPADRLPTVTLSNIECYQPLGDNWVYFRFDYRVENHPEDYPNLYRLVSPLKEREWSTSLGHHKALEGTAHLQVPTHRRQGSEMQVWVTLGGEGGGYDAGPEQQVSEVYTCEIRQETPPWVEEKERLAQARDAAKQRMEEIKQLPPIDSALATIAEGDNSQKRDALSRLSKMLVDEARQAEVVAAVLPLLRSPDDWTRKEALRAIGAWGNSDAVPAVIELLSESRMSREAAAVLGKLKDERAVEPLANLLEDFALRGPAAEALRSIGSAAEDGLAAYVTHPDPDVRREVCKILADVGTMKSVPELFKLEHDPDRGVYREADQAIRKIRFRHQRDNPEAAAEENKPREPIRFTPQRRGR